MSMECKSPALVLISHGNLAREALNSARMILGPIEGTEALSFSSTGSVDELQKDLEGILDRWRTERPVLVMADLFGGSCCNVASRLMVERDAQVIAGFNLGMVIEFAASRDFMGPRELAEKLVAGGRKAIIHVNQMLEAKKEKGA